MGKVAQNSAKYVIEAELSANGIVEKPDVVGAIFGQTEGLLGEDLDLRELQERGKIGRIHVEVEKNNGSSDASIRIPSSLDSTNTAVLAASLETIERVGPTNASIEVSEIRDERVSKRDYIVKRAKQLLDDMQDDTPDSRAVTEEVKQEVRSRQVTRYEGFEAGPEADADELILVEGRADLLNLLKHGVKNVVALGGTSVPENIVDTVEGKKVTAFLDGDRGADLIMEELKEKIELDSVARAPENKEVEELGKEQVFEALRDSQPVKFAEESGGDQQEAIDEDERLELKDVLEELVGTRAVYIVDEEIEIKEKLPLDTFQEMDSVEDCRAVVLDGEIDRETVEKAESLDADCLVGMKKDGYANSSKLQIITREELRVEV